VIKNHGHIMSHNMSPFFVALSHLRRGYIAVWNRSWLRTGDHISSGHVENRLAEVSTPGVKGRPFLQNAPTIVQVEVEPEHAVPKSSSRTWPNNAPATPVVSSGNWMKQHENHETYRRLAVPSGKRLHNYGKSPFLMGKSTISMAIFSSFLYVYQAG